MPPPPFNSFAQQNRRIFDISAHTLFSPLACNAPHPILKDWTITSTNFTDQLHRQHIIDVVEALGATYSNGLSKDTNILLCHTAEVSV